MAYRYRSLIAQLRLLCSSGAELVHPAEEAVADVPEAVVVDEEAAVAIWDMELDAPEALVEMGEREKVVGLVPEEGELRSCKSRPDR